MEIIMAEIINNFDGELTLQVKIKLNGSMMEMEDTIQNAVNEVGSLATKVALEKFDTTGKGIQIADVRFTSKGKILKRYETPYGAVDITRHVYQTAQGEKTYCPLDKEARIIVSSTPRFAKIISYKYGNSSAQSVSKDLSMNHGRDIARSFLQRVSDFVGSIAQATEEDWAYELPKQTDEVTTVSLSMDGTCVLTRQDGYREAVVGTIGLYNPTGDRLYSIYIGEAPERGKTSFFKRFEQEIAKVKKKYPHAKYIGIADGARVNWDFLKKHTSLQILDFYHATEYLAEASYAIHPSNEFRRKRWLTQACHRLKHQVKSSLSLLREMEKLSTDDLRKDIRDKLERAITYFCNQGYRMRYHYYRAKNLPIGSGVTEAACKVLVKQRLGCSGMKWKKKGIKVVLSLRALILTQDRWLQFWDRLNQTGIEAII